MALADRDIIITPNRGAASEPNILFRGADASSSASITLKVYNSGTIGTLSFEGTSGQLFSLTDSMVGTIFSANDISGIPSIEVLDTGLVKLAQYNGQVTVSTGTAVSGASLTVAGMAYVTGEIRSGNEVTAYYTSDERLKENVRLISNPIGMIKQINGVYYDWTDEYIESRGGEDGFFVRKDDVGVIAQQVEKILPQLVATRDNGYKAVKYEKIVPLLIECIKSQQMQIDQILERLENLANK